jgi:universal stress protein E
MDTLRSIVAAVDFTDCSLAAVKEAVRIARFNQAPLHPVHVIETLVLADLEEAVGGADPGFRDTIVADTRAAWREFSAGVEGVEDASLEILVDQPAEGIAASVAKHRADLLVMGVRGTSEGHGAGTLAAHAARLAKVKTLLVQPGHAGAYRRIVVAVDFSETSREALLAAMRIAVQDGAVVHAVHIFNPPWLRLHYRSATPQATSDYRKQFLDGLARRLERFCDPGDPETRWVKPTFHVLEHRSHGVGIVDFALANAADLVVLGTRGRTNLRDLVLGSTAERVLRHAPCSILAVPPAK